MALGSPRGAVMTRTRRLGFAAVTLLVVAVLLAGCGSTSGGAAARHVTVVLDWTPNTNHAGVYLAKADGLYNRAGLDVEIIEPGEAGGLPELAAGRATFAFSYAEQLLPARAQGTPVVSIATVLTTNTSSLVSPADRAIHRPRDLEGHTYGTFGGQIERPLIEALVRCDGGDPTKVKFLDVGNADYTVGFRKHAYDAVWVFDGWDVIRLRDVAHLAVTTIPFRGYLQCIPDWYTPILAANERLLRDDPGLVRSFLKATAEGYRRAAAHPAAAAAALIAAVPESDRTLVRTSARFLAPFYLARGRWGVQDPAVWRRFAAFLRTNAIITGGPDVATAFTNAFLPPTR
jgi:ABC-type nitrate/sulfonate/bicarbonate transport system substrate-binding protein